MKKNILITLLAASATGTAFANVNLTDSISDWSLAGVPGDDAVLGKLELLVPNLAGGTASQTISKLPQGKYILSWDAATAKNVKVTANGKEVKNGVSFDFAGGALEITIGPADAGVNLGGYFISGIKLEIDCNPTQFRADLLAAIDKAGTTFGTLNENVKDEAVIKAFADRKEAIEKELTDLKAEAEKLPQGNEISLEEYEKYYLGVLTEDHPLYTELSDIEDEIEVYNGDVTLTNAKANLVAKAVEAKDTAEAKLNGLEDNAAVAAMLESVGENAQAKWIGDQITKEEAAIREKQQAVGAEILALAEVNADSATTLKEVAEVDKALDEQVKAVDKSIDAFSKELGEFKTTLAGVIAVADNYNAIYVNAGSADVPSVKYLEEEVNKARKELFALDGVYGAVQQQANVNIDKIYTQAIENLAIDKEDVATADEDNFTHDQGVLKDAINDIKAVVKKAQDLAASDGPFGKVAAQIEDLINSVEPLDGIRPSNEGDLSKEKEAIDNKINDLQSKLNAALANGTIEDGMFDTEISAIKKDIAAYNKNVAASQANEKVYQANNDQLVKAKGELEALWKGWEDTEKKEIGSHPNWWITTNSQFIDSYENVLNFIKDEIAKNDEARKGTKDIVPLSAGIMDTFKASVEGLKNTGGMIITEIVSVGKAYDTYTGYATAIGKVLETKNAYGKDARKPYEEDLADIVTTLTTMSNDLSNAVSTQDTGQQIYLNVKKVKDDYSKVDFNADLNNVLTDIETGLTESNKEFVANSLTGFKESLPAGSDVPGKANIEKMIGDFTSEINDVTVPTVTADIKALADISKYAAKFKDADAAIAVVNGFLPQVNAATNACVTNYNNHEANAKEIAALVAKVETIRTASADYAAKASYDALLDAELTKIAKLTADNDKEYKKFKVDYSQKVPVYDKDGNLKEDRKVTIKPGTPMATGLNKAIANEETSIKNLETKIEQNEKNYQNLIDESTDLGMLLNTYLEDIKAHISDASEDAPGLAEDMEALLRQLYGYNSTIRTAYLALFEKKGATYADIERMLTDLENEATKLYKSLGGEVRDYNNGLFETVWEDEDSSYKAAYNTYIETVKAFDTYNEVITNAGFLAFVYNGIKVSDLLDNTNAALFEYVGLIRQLNIDANTLLVKLNGENKTITDQFDEGTQVEKDKDGTIVSGFITQAGEYKTAIEDQLTTFTTQINAAAEAYYQKLKKDKAAMLATAQTDLVNVVGIEEEDAVLLLSGLQANYDKAVGKYDTVMEKAADSLAQNISEICDEFDKINNATINAAANEVAKAAWTKAYEAAIKEAKVSFEGCKDIDTTEYDKLFNEVEALNGEAENYYNAKDLFGYLSDLKSDVAAAAAAAKDKGEELKANWMPTNQQLYDEFMGTGYRELQEMFTALKTSVLPLASAPDELDNLNAIEDQIEALKNDVEQAGEKFVTYVLGNVQSYKDAGRYKNIVNNIDNVYSLAYKNALAYLQSNVDAVKAGFNSALADGKVPANVNVDELWDGINNLSVEISEMLNDTVTVDEAKENIGKVLKMQEKLAGYQVQVDGYLDIDKVSGVVEVLNGAYDKVAGELTNLQSALEVSEEEVKAEYEAQVAEVAKTLENIKSMITDDPDIIYQQTNIEDQLNRVSKQISALSNEISDANTKVLADKKKAAENQEKYNELIVYPQKLEGVVDLLEEDSEFFDFNTPAIDTGRYDVDIYTNQLDKAKNNLSLTSWSDGYVEVWTTGIENHVGYTNEARISGSLTSTNIAFSDADYMVTRVTNAVYYFDYKHPGMAGRFSGDLADIVMAFGQIEETKEFTGDTQDTAAVTAYINEIKEIFTQANAVYADAQALIDLINLNDVVAGDANGDGQVTISDVAKLLNWVLDNTAFDENDRGHIAADLNGNGKLDTSDIQHILNIIFGSANRAQALQRMAPVAANISVAAERVAVANGAQRFDINLANDTKLVGGMVDIVLADGMEITSLMPTERLEGLEFYTNDLGDGVTRVVFISTGAPCNIAGTEGAIFNVEVSGNGNVSLENIEFTNAQAHLYTVGNVGNTSGIEGLWNDFKAFGRRIYNAGGQMLNRLQRGINIVTNSDGTSSKILKK